MFGRTRFVQLSRVALNSSQLCKRGINFCDCHSSQIAPAVLHPLYSKHGIRYISKYSSTPPTRNFSSSKDGILEIENFAKIDIGRAERTGFPEVVFGEGKTVHQIAKILQAINSKLPGKVAIATRVSLEQWEKLRHMLDKAQYEADARIVIMNPKQLPKTPLRGKVCVVAAGTSDLSVAEEACITLLASGYEPTRVYDVGVAGIYRLFAKLDVIRSAQVVIVVAGMDGALPSVVAGLVHSPVIAVPTSVGYGAAFQGVAPLLTMLNACSPGITVTNIDNGFGAAASCVKILQLLEPLPSLPPSQQRHEGEPLHTKPDTNNELSKLDKDPTSL